MNDWFDTGILGRNNSARVQREVGWIVSQVDFGVGEYLAMNPDSPLGVPEEGEFQMSNSISSEVVMHTVKPRLRYSQVCSHHPTQECCSGYRSD